MKAIKLKIYFVIKFLFISILVAVNAVAAEKEKNTYLQSTQDPIDSLLPMLGGLLVIVIFIFFLAYLFKRFSNLNSGTRLINVVESYAIGHKEKLAIIQVKDECFLIGVTANSINSIGKLDASQINETINTNDYQEKGKASFAPIIAKFMSGKMTAEVVDKKKMSAKKNEK